MGLIWLIITVLVYQKESKTKNNTTDFENRMSQLSNALSIVFISLKLVEILRIEFFSVTPRFFHVGPHWIEKKQQISCSPFLLQNLVWLNWRFIITLPCDRIWLTTSPGNILKTNGMDRSLIATFSRPLKVKIQEKHQIKDRLTHSQNFEIFKNSTRY